jgi:hypothetical protein
MASSGGTSGGHIAGIGTKGAMLDLQRHDGSMGCVGDGNGLPYQLR